MKNPPRFSYQVTWADLDGNNHMENAKYFSYASQTRFLYLQSAGYSPSKFAELGIGPAVVTETMSYFRELRHLDRFDVTLALGGKTTADTRFVFVNRYYLEDGTECAHLRSMFVWFSRIERKRVAPPAGLLEACLALPKDAHYEDL